MFEFWLLRKECLGIELRSAVCGNLHISILGEVKGRQLDEIMKLPEWLTGSLGEGVALQRIRNIEKPRRTRITMDKCV